MLLVLTNLKIDTPSVMKKMVHRILLLGLLANLTGCMAVTIQSNMKANARPEFRRILIVSRLSNLTATYLPSFQTAFPVGYQVCTVSNSPISFDDPAEAIEKQRNSCQSEVMLTIDFSRNYTSGTGKYAVSYDELYMEMTSFATGKPFWKAIVTAGGAEVPPRKIVDQLIKDGVLETGISPVN